MRSDRRSGKCGIVAAALVAVVGAAGPVKGDDAGATTRGDRRGEGVSAGSSAPTPSVAEHRDRGRRTAGRTRSRQSGRHGYYLGWGPSWGTTWGGYWGGYWDPYWYGPRVGYTAVYPRTGARYGALDTDVSPERAEVWLDGRKIGVADDFDGFPNYLWLEKGTYDVVFYRPGFQTIARQYSIYPGLVIDVEDRMEPGEAIHPLDLAPKSHERRDERLRRDLERRESAAGAASEWAPEARRERADEPWLDARAEPGRLRLEVSPGDASVYLDGRFVGTGDDLARLRAGLLIDSGRHTLEIVRPGYRSVEQEVEVESAEEAELRLELEPQSAGEP